MSLKQNSKSCRLKVVEEESCQNSYPVKIAPKEEEKESKEGMGHRKGVIGYLSVWNLECGNRDIKK